VIFHSYFNFILFIPIALFRVASRLIPFNKILLSKKSSGSDFSYDNKLISGTLYKIFALENSILKRGMALPFGVSILDLRRKI
jgi:hypothetical protein